MGLLPLTYRRPRYVSRESLRDSDSATLENDKSDTSLKSGTSGRSTGIPEHLAFDRIIKDGTCPPCTKRDFMNYLIYVERSAENLQFFLWYTDYVQRFENAPKSDTVLAPEWTQAQEDELVSRNQKEKFEKLRPKEPGSEIFQGTDFEKKQAQPLVVENPNPNPFSTPPLTPGGSSMPADQDSLFANSQAAQTNIATYRSQTSEAFAAAGAKTPFTIQPFREEIDRVLATYIIDGAPRQLNLSDREQTTVLHALAYTTHPSAFRIVHKSIDHCLRQQAHPNFIRWSICNGNPARVLFARSLGASLIVLAFAAAIVLTLSSAPRGWRALAAIGWVLGISTLVAAYKGMCVVLHGMHHHHVRPWELFVDDGEEAGKNSFDSFGSSNSYEEEPWIVKYEKRNVVRKIFDREVWIREPALRQIQDTIFVQAMLCALLISGICTAVFVVLPHGNFF